MVACGAAPQRSLVVEVVRLVGLKYNGRILGDVLVPTPRLEGSRPYATLTLGPLSTALPPVAEGTGTARWTTSFQYWNETEVRIRVLHQQSERRDVQSDLILGEAALPLNPASLDGRPAQRMLDLSLGTDAFCGRAEVRFYLAEPPAGGPGAGAGPQAPLQPAGPDAGGGGAARPIREGFRFRVSGLGSLAEADISRHFSRYGEVLGVDLAHDPRTGAPAGKASVRLCGFDSSSKSAVFNDSHLVSGYKLVVTDDCERKLFIGGFKDTPSSVVRDHFALFGELEEFDAAVRDQNGKPRGYAFVRFVRQEDVDRVLAQPEHQINGRTCTVRKAESRPVPLPKSEADSAGGGKRRATQQSLSRSRSGDGARRRARGGARNRQGKGGLQVAPGYEYKDGVGAQPSMGYMPPGDRPVFWGPPPPPPHYGYPPGGPPPGYGAAPPGMPPVAYGSLPPSYGHPGPPPGYGMAPPQGWPPPPAMADPGVPREGPPRGYEAAMPPPGSGAYGPPLQGGYGLPPGSYGPPPSGYGSPPPGTSSYVPPPSSYGGPPPPGSGWEGAAKGGPPAGFGCPPSGYYGPMAMHGGPPPSEYAYR